MTDLADEIRHFCSEVEGRVYTQPSLKAAHFLLNYCGKVEFSKNDLARYCCKRLLDNWSIYSISDWFFILIGGTKEILLLILLLVLKSPHTKYNGFILFLTFPSQGEPFISAM